MNQYKDVVVEPLYDSVNYPVGGNPTLTFFTVPMGQGQSCWQTAAGVLPKTVADTNMQLAGQLSAGWYFKVLGFRVGLPWHITDNDMHFVINPAVFTFFKSAKNFLQVPLATIPGGNGPYGSGASMNSNGKPILKNGYTIGNKPLDIGPSESFGCTLTWPSGLFTPCTTTAGVIVGAGLVGIGFRVYIDGFKYRPIQ